MSRSAVSPAVPRSATATSTRQRRRSDRGTLQAAAPPVLALVVSSPAILAGLAGTADPLQVLTVVAVSLATMWLLLAALAQLGRRRPEPATVPVRTTDDRPASGAAHLGRIEPVQVPASEAIPGDPPPTPATEGPLA